MMEYTCPKCKEADVNRIELVDRPGGPVVEVMWKCDCGHVVKREAVRWPIPSSSTSRPAD